RRSDKSSTGNVRSWVSMSDANPAPARSGALCGAEIAAVTTGAGAPPRASNDIFASRTSSGLERRSAGYAVSSWLTSSVEAVEIDAVDLLERRYLRHVQDVANADGVRIEFQAAVAIDSEVAERMRVRVRRPRQRKRYQREDRDSDRGGCGA